MLAIPILDDRGLQSISDAASSEAAGQDAGGLRKDEFDKALPLVFPNNNSPNEYTPVKQGISRADFSLRLANLPEEALDRSMWVTDVVRDGSWDPELEPSGQDGESTTSLREERLRTHPARAHGKEKWMPVLYVPTIQFSTPIPTVRREARAPRRGRDSAPKAAKLPCFMVEACHRDPDFDGRQGVLEALADEPEMLHDYWPILNTGSILVTSRHELW